MCDLSTPRVCRGFIVTHHLILSTGKKREYDMKKKYIIFGIFVGGLSLSAKAGVSAYDKMLIKYCVPKNGRCDTKATYRDGASCSCPSGKMYVDRECLALKCPAGTYISLNNNTNNCSPGMYRGLYRN